MMASGHALRLISWNVNGRYGRALAKQIAAVCERSPDVVALQEVRHESRRAWLEGLELAGLTHTIDSSDLLGLGSRSGREYRRIYFNVLASRWPLRRLADLPLEFPERYLAATVARDGDEFELHNAHLPPGSTRGLVKIEMFEALYRPARGRRRAGRGSCAATSTRRAQSTLTARSSSGARITGRTPSAGTTPSAACVLGPRRA